MDILMNYARPVCYTALRSLLAIVDDAGVRGDVATLENARNLIPPFDGDVRMNCTTYINGLIEVITQDNPVYNEADITAARLSLERVAYGNFDEAMHALGQDLMAIDPDAPREMASDIFRPEFFNPEDREIWQDLRHVIEKFKERPSGEYCIEAYQAYRALREYQQRSYGSLLPAMVATYMRRDGKDAEGVSVRLALVDGTLNIVAAEPLTSALRAHFADDTLIEATEDFTEDRLPHDIGEYELMDVVCADMYRYEL